MKISIPKMAFADQLQITPGSYPAQVTKAEIKDTKAGDSEYVNWEFTITEGEFAGKLVWLATSLKESAMWRIVSLLNALGVDLAKVEKAENFELDSAIGKGITLLIGEEEYNSKMKPKVVDFYPLGE